MNVDLIVICGRLRACAAAKRAYQHAGSLGQMLRMQRAIDRLLDEYNDAVFRHIVAGVQP